MTDPENANFKSKAFALEGVERNGVVLNSHLNFAKTNLKIYDIKIDSNFFLSDVDDAAIQLINF